MIKIILKLFVISLIFSGCSKEQKKVINKEQKNIIVYCNIEDFDLDFLMLNGKMYSSSNEEHLEYRGVYKSKNVFMNSNSQGYALRVYTDSTISFNRYDLDWKIISHKLNSALGYDILEYKVNSKKEIYDLVNYDELYNFSIDNVFKFMSDEKINSDFMNYNSLEDPEFPVPYIYRGDISQYGYKLNSDNANDKHFVWILSNVQRIDKFEILYIILDGQTGEELCREIYMGKGPAENYGTEARYDLKYISSKIKAL
ncbi:hypothetical protein NWE55_14720 [Myroides albus]|uniref:hypothetical protein n=1 Tax=Myroides albus TaxID=2562892 RepID=UPI002158D7D0|nr:hypothetical protein [Myroides albus]UVD79365.1 hypothetical protein NWE55_14720 [Myroides albus]